MDTDRLEIQPWSWA